jgi:hypothetical protein
LLALPVVAQETTGSIEGTVRDNSGGVLPGVTVEAVGPSGTISSVTDSNGRFRFARVPPGSYRVRASLSGFRDATSPAVTASLGSTQTVNLVLSLSAVAETITVTAETPIVDVTSSAVSDSVTREQIAIIPRGRDFTDVVSQTPGAINDRQAGGISIDGATGLENRYVIDGIDTTDPQIGDSSVPMRAEFFEEVQVKTAGYGAEFGGSTGGVINAITRSGRNEFDGGILVDYEDSSLNGDRRPVLRRSGQEAALFNYDNDDETRIDPGFFLGGPILRDRLWFFGSYQPGIRETARTVTFVNGVTDTYNQDFNVDYITGNLTANIGSKLLLKAGLSMSPYETEGLLPLIQGQTTVTNQANYAPLGSKGERETYSANADFLMSDSLVFSGRGGYYKTNYEDTGLPFFDVIHEYSTASAGTPGTLFPSLPANLKQPLGFRNNPLYNAVARDIYERTSYAVDGTWFVNAGGEHAIKAGYQTEQIANDVRNGYNADRILYYWNRAYSTTTGESRRGTYGHFRLLNISTLGVVESNNDAIFLQDSWAVLPNLMLNIGVRAEHERVPNFGATGPKTAIEFAFDEKVAPRLGFAWDVLGDAQWKVYGSYGTYYDVMKYEMPRGSFGGDKWVDFYYTFDNPDFNLNDAVTCRTGSNTIVERPNCPAGTLIEVVDRRHNAADPSDPTVDPDLKPMELMELQLGADRQLGTNMKAGIRLVHKELIRAIEDVGILVPGVGEVYYIANPGEGLTTSLATMPFPKAEREYDAAELTFEKRMTNNWALFASYTFSELWGNYSGLANTEEMNTLGDAARLSPNVSRLFDVVQSSYDRNGDLVYGKLATDRPHQFKAQLMYQFPWDMTMGVNQVLMSGTPITETATVPIHSFFNPYGRGNEGRTPTLSQTDLSLYQNIPLAALNLQLGVTVLNLLDQDTELRYWSVRTTQDLPISEEAFFAGAWDYEQVLAGLAASGGLDPAYGMPDNFQAPREVRLTLKLTF